MAADPLTPWFDFWKSATQAPAQAPEVLSQWQSLFAPQCAPSTLIEAQQAAWDHMLTVSEMWWTMWMGAWTPAALMSPRGWDGHPRPELRVVHDVPATVASPEAEAKPKRQRQG